MDNQANTQSSTNDREKSVAGVSRGLPARLEQTIADWQLWRDDPTQAFENLAAEFYAETGMLAPGKSQPLEASNVMQDVERRTRYEAWTRARQDARWALLREAAETITRLETERDEARRAADCPMIQCPYEARAEAAEARVAQLEAAIRWALGEEGEFGDEPPPLAGKYRQRFWWRSELRERSKVGLRPPSGGQG